MTSTLDPTMFVPRSGESWRDPFTMYADLRVHDPVHFVQTGGYWVLSRFDDVASAATDTSTFSSAHGLTPLPGEQDIIKVLSPMVMLDPPDHTAFRRLVSRGFQPRHVASIEPDVRQFVRDRIDALRHAGRADIVAELFKPLPSMVVANYLGVPHVDRPSFDRWTDAIVSATALGAPTQAKDAALELMQYFTELIEVRRREPLDDTISHLVQASSGDAGAGSDTVPLLQMLGFAFTMVTGGNDTSTGLLSGACELLTAHPDAQAALVADPSRIPAAVEEFLRLTCPVQGLARTVTRDIELRGRSIPSGSKVLLLYASANRDEAEFGPDADHLRIDRNPGRILSFSHGAHHCLGAAAARLMARVALEELLDAFPTFTVDAEAGEFAPGNFVRRYRSLPWQA